MWIKGVVYRLVFAFVGDNDGIGVEFEGLGYQQVGIGACAEYLNGKEVAMSADDVEGLGADRTSGT